MMDLSNEDLRRRVARANLMAYDTSGASRYIDGAPHIKHAVLRRLYADLLIEVFNEARRHSNIPNVLDLGAGEGSATLPLLELGANVTAVDISPEQLAELKSKCAKYGARLTVRCEDSADTVAKDSAKYDIIVANSFLHHIPDYLGLIRSSLRRVSAAGQFFSFQDPLLYSTQSRLERLFDKVAYAAWRIRKDDVWKGLLRRIRRSRGIYLAESEYDNAEYHVLRNGIDQEAMGALFEEAGFSSRTVRYFSTQSKTFQWLGEALGLKNTFAFIAARNS